MVGKDYVHLSQLAPTAGMLKAYRDGKSEWAAYERDFLALMRDRRVEKAVPRELIDGGCLLCSEATPDHCLRRLVAEYLQDRWPGVVIAHLA